MQAPPIEDQSTPPGRLLLPQLSVLRQHRAADLPDSGIIEIPCTDHHSVIVQLKDFKEHKLWRGKQLVYSGGHAQASVAITHLQDEWKCQHASAFDNVRFTIARAAFDDLSLDAGRGRIGGLDFARGASDPVIYHLTQALLPALDQPREAHRLFIDHVAQALLQHVAQRYGNMQAVQEYKGGLAAWQERRAKEYMENNLARGISLEDVARECGVSRTHFSRGFKRSTGVMAYAWLHGLRIAKAKSLLRDLTRSLPQIALECGFADQSHFTRAFKKTVGVPPGIWRRQY